MKNEQILQALALQLDRTLALDRTLHRDSFESSLREVATRLAALATPQPAAPAQGLTDEREAFEVWASREGFRLEHRGNFMYRDETTDEAWRSWQARAALAATPTVAQPVGVFYEALLGSGSYSPPFKETRFRVLQEMPAGTKVYTTLTRPQLIAAAEAIGMQWPERMK